MIYIVHFWMIMHLPNLDDLFDPLLDDSEHACKPSEIG